MLGMAHDPFYEQAVMLIRRMPSDLTLSVAPAEGRCCLTVR